MKSGVSSSSDTVMIFLESYLGSAAHFSKELNSFGQFVYFSKGRRGKGFTERSGEWTSCPCRACFPTSVFGSAQLPCTPGLEVKIIAKIILKYRSSPSPEPHLERGSCWGWICD